MVHWGSLLDDAWNLYRQFEGEPFLVKPSIPILFFGDSERYFQSERKVITVGLNPSRIEFPSGDPFLRFRAAERLSDENDQEKFNRLYVKVLNDYFKNEPYSNWFNPSFENLLNGMGCSYYDNRGYSSIALHTDLCSPLATDPTWSRLHPLHRDSLEPQGAQLWHDLVERLAPDVMIVSVASRHLRRLRFSSVNAYFNVSGERTAKVLRRPQHVVLFTRRFCFERTVRRNRCVDLGLMLGVER
jgi:hypothetical protein